MCYYFIYSMYFYFIYLFFELIVILDFSVFVILSQTCTYVDSKRLLLTLRSEYQEGRAIIATRRLHVGCVFSTKPTTKKVSKQYHLKPCCSLIWSGSCWDDWKQIRSLILSSTLCYQTVEFTWENISPVEQQGFKVAPMQGSVDAGHRCPITISWMPPSGLAVSTKY